MAAKVEAPVTNSMIATVGFNRKVSVRQYESAEASIFIQTEVSMDDPEQSLKNIQESFFTAKSVVFEQLGIPFEIGEGGVIRELINKHLGPVTEVKQSSAPQEDSGARSPAEPSAGADAQSQPPFPSRTTDKNEKAANIEWAKARYKSNPDEFYDNRESNAEKRAAGAQRVGPDFKHKTSGVGYWL